MKKSIFILFLLILSCEKSGVDPVQAQYSQKVVIDERERIFEALKELRFEGMPVDHSRTRNADHIIEILKNEVDVPLAPWHALKFNSKYIAQIQPKLRRDYVVDTKEAHFLDIDAISYDIILTWYNEDLLNYPLRPAWDAIDPSKDGYGGWETDWYVGQIWSVGIAAKELKGDVYSVSIVAFTGIQ